MRANYSAYHLNLEPFHSPKLLTIEELDHLIHLVHSIPEIVVVEGHAHNERAHAETGFRLENRPYVGQSHWVWGGLSQ